MLKKSTLHSSIFIFGIPLFLFGILILISQTAFLRNPNNLLALGISLDLFLCIPLIYFFLIRKTKIPKTTIVPMMVIGFLIGTYILPKEHHFYLQLFKTWLLPIIEITVLTYVLIKLRKTLIKLRTIKNSDTDFFTALKNTCSEILPKKLVLPFATEIAVIYFGFFQWRKRKQQHENEFTYHKESGSLALMAVIIFMVLVETVAMHFLLQQWSSLAAWILSGFSLYTCLQFFGFLKSISKRPILVTENSLILRNGIMNETNILFEDIDSITYSSKDLEENKLSVKLAMLGELEGHNVILKLKKENELVGIYGLRKKYIEIAFFVDDLKGFREKMAQIH
ncbi:hypothetical protein [Aureivirga sp. CE67]|uniref:hypothetical protein n=1 Tax=Aureivirga sp. CE67 TaxID=1788983 RepID=UPI0018CB82AF|nr:hypothetical protein [Aureivirga sp. CE67]